MLVFEQVSTTSGSITLAPINNAVKGVDFTLEPGVEISTQGGAVTINAAGNVISHCWQHHLDESDHRTGSRFDHDPGRYADPRYGRFDRDRVGHICFRQRPRSRPGRRKTPF